jgi:hypothetical protein
MSRCQVKLEYSFAARQPVRSCDATIVIGSYRYSGVSMQAISCSEPDNNGHLSNHDVQAAQCSKRLS